MHSMAASCVNDDQGRDGCTVAQMTWTATRSGSVASRRLAQVHESLRSAASGLSEAGAGPDSRATPDHRAEER